MHNTLTVQVGQPLEQLAEDLEDGEEGEVFLLEEVGEGAVVLL